MASFDLHLHTHWSYDAFSAVEDYFRLAREKKTRAIAITDHHLMDGYNDVLSCAEKYPDVGYFSGAEITVNSPFGAVDLVCLNLPRRPEGELAGVFEIYRNWQVAYGDGISRNMCQLGFPFCDAERLKLLQTYRPEAAVAKQGNTHVRAGTMAAYCEAQGFGDYKVIRRQFRDMPLYPDFETVVPAVKAAGGVIFIAHPFGYFLENDRKRMDALREMLQLDGVECAHPHVPAEMTPVYRAYCKEFGLLSSGSSDLHTPDAEKFAENCAPDFWLDEILERVTLYHGN
ncbi:MAG: PHP domain-containing protein [Lentisphaeria bacterium]|nr:PHP domain-containing protein [Lentisphaeria bacterium]